MRGQKFHFYEYFYTKRASGATGEMGWLKGGWTWASSLLEGPGRFGLIPP